LLALLRGFVESQNLEFVEDSSFYRISNKQAERPTGRPAVSSDSGPVQLFVIRLLHARAADVAATVNQLFGGGGEFSGHSDFQRETLSDELRRNVLVPAAGQQPQQAQPPARQSSLSGSVTIVPERTDELDPDSCVRP